jgi:hypothetical protein
MDLQRWKYAILANIFLSDSYLLILYPFGMKNISFNSFLSWSFRIWKNLGNRQSNSDTIARWRSITFFLYTLYMQPNPGRRQVVFAQTDKQCDLIYSKLNRTACHKLSTSLEQAVNNL